MYRIITGFIILALLSGCSALPSAGSVATRGINTTTPIHLSSTHTILQVITTSPSPLLPTSTITRTILPDAYVVASWYANILAGPGRPNPQIDALKPGEKAQAIGTTPSGDWIKIVYPHGPDGVGWVYADAVVLHTTSDLPIAPEAESLTPAPTVQASSEELAVIRVFNPAETLTHYRLQKNTFDPNVPDLTVDIFHVNGVEYVVDPHSLRVVEYLGMEDPGPMDSANVYTSDQLKALATRLVISQVTGIDLSQYSFETNSKGVNYSFRWSKGKPGESGYELFIQVVYWPNGKLFQYINTLQ